MVKKILKNLARVLVYGFAIVGFAFVAMYFAVKWHWTDVEGIIDEQTEFFRQSGQTASANSALGFTATSSPTWAQGEEWQVFSNAVRKDAVALNKAAAEAGVSPRLIMSALAVEQLRLFFSQREVYKEVFAPLKILGDQSQFSWGVMGIKPDTAKAIEEHLKDSASPYYLGVQYENLLDFKTADRDSERFERIVNEREHYYSYLYAGLYIKQLITQWKNAGIDISQRPEIVGTLFNIGFTNSNPNPEPKSGGAEIEIGTTTYSFGLLAGEIYNSKELSEFAK
ncbi:MAG: hypothetical protein WC757_03400 [Candidatus Paceibacterota bacterium]|jgi:hypothetical protein